MAQRHPWLRHAATWAPDEFLAFAAWMQRERDLASFVPEAWRTHPVLADFLQTDAWRTVELQLRDEYADSEKPIYPPFPALFKPLQLVGAPSRVRVILPALEPYPFGSSNGLAYGVKDTAPIPEILANILSVRDHCMLEAAIAAATPATATTTWSQTGQEQEPPSSGGKRPRSPSPPSPPTTASVAAAVPSEQQRTVTAPRRRQTLEDWATQGVLLAHIHWTVRANERKSHVGFGWDGFFHAVCEAAILATEGTLVCLLLGADPRRTLEAVVHKHGVSTIETTHPSALTWEGKPDRPSSSFRHGLPFLRVNQLLKMQGAAPVQW